MVLHPWLTNRFFLLVRYNIFGLVHFTYLGVSKNIVFFCLKIFFTFTNRVDPDEMQHDAAFHLGLHYLLKHSLRGFRYTKG